MNLQFIESRLVEILNGFEGMLPPEQLDDMRSLANAGEPGVALENFCTQLYEYDVSVPATVLEELSKLGSAMGIRPEYWLDLTVR